MFSKGYRTQRGVTGPMNFKESEIFLKSEKIEIFFGKSCSRDFGAPGSHPDTLIDLANTALAIKCLVKNICMISQDYRTHRGVTGPMNFKNSAGFFSENLAREILGPLSAIQAL